jgi:hypothetical protein
MRRISFFAITTLLILNNILYHECLLELGVISHFFLDCEFDLQPFWMRFCPDEASINKLDSFESFDLLQTDSQQFWRLKFASNPGRFHVPVAFSAVLQVKLLADTLWDINLRFQTVYASIWSIRSCHYSTHAASSISLVNTIGKVQIHFRCFSYGSVNHVAGWVNCYLTLVVCHGIVVGLLVYRRLK